jgi:hypothetical protein
VWLEGGDGIFS